MLSLVGTATSLERSIFGNPANMSLLTSVRLISEQIQLVPSTNCFIRLLKSFGNK
jgi:hypothetical protein